jgi:hypothetical protein
MSAPHATQQFRGKIQPPPTGSNLSVSGLVQNAASLAVQTAVRETNPVKLCRLGQDTLTEIVQKTTEIFSHVRSPLLNLTMQQFTDRKTKLDDSLRRVEVLFVKLREVYDAVIEASSTVEPVAVEELLSIEDTVEPSVPTDPLMSMSNEERKLVEQIQHKNRQLKEIIDHQRMIIWEINTMMAMRRTTAVDK